MRRLKKRKKLSIKPIICITTIAMLNFIGVSYGVWSENLNLDFGITTGYIKPQFYLDDQKIVGNKNGEITLDISSDKRTLYIEGWCYPGFNNNISLGIKNRGSIPVVSDKISEIDDDDIIRLNDNKEYFIDHNHEKKFKIQINSNNKNDKVETDDIQALIDELNIVENHTFKYKLIFEQGIK